MQSPLCIVQNILQKASFKASFLRYLTYREPRFWLIPQNFFTKKIFFLFLLKNQTISFILRTIDDIHHVIKFVEKKD